MMIRVGVCDASPDHCFMARGVLGQMGIEESPSTGPLGRASCRWSRSSPAPSLPDTGGGRLRTVSLCVGRPR